MNRREFLRSTLTAAGLAAVGGAGGLLAGCGRNRGGAPNAGSQPAAAFGAGAPPDASQRKLILVLFGGGTRNSESIDDPEHRWIPRLWKEMVPRGTLLSNMRVEGKVVHPNSAGSIVTGQWEWDDIDWSHPVDHATLFEVFRKARGRGDTAAWAFVYASILANIAHSRAAGYGTDFAANVVEPPTIPRATAEEMDRLLRHAAAAGSPGAETQAATQAARLARTTGRISTAGLRSPAARAFVQEHFAAWQQAAGVARGMGVSPMRPTGVPPVAISTTGMAETAMRRTGETPVPREEAGRNTTSHDAFLTDLAIAAMGRFAPDVLAVCYGEIDCAHYGSWSRYVEAIARTDELTARLYRAAQELPAYRGRTLMLVLPDHGRELERPGGPGFIHHSDFYTNQDADEGCRHVWLLAVGPGVPAGRVLAQPAPITAVAATALEYLGLPGPPGAEKSLWPLLR